MEIGGTIMCHIPPSFLLSCGQSHCLSMSKNAISDVVSGAISGWVMGNRYGCNWQYVAIFGNIWKYWEISGNMWDWCVGVVQLAAGQEKQLVFEPPPPRCLFFSPTTPSKEENVTELGGKMMQ